jgi:hypothetical protein
MMQNKNENNQTKLRKQEQNKNFRLHSGSRSGDASALCGLKK